MVVIKFLLSRGETGVLCLFRMTVKEEPAQQFRVYRFNDIMSNHKQANNGEKERGGKSIYLRSLVPFVRFPANKCFGFFI